MTAEAEQVLVRSIFQAIKGLCESELPDQTLGLTVRRLMSGAKEGTPIEVPVERELEYLKVRLADGTATNVSVPKALLFQASQKLGGEPAVRKRVRELAKRAPATVNNRSGWIQDQLTQSLATA